MSLTLSWSSQHTFVIFYLQEGEAEARYRTCVTVPVRFSHGTRETTDSKVKKSRSNSVEVPGHTSLGSQDITHGQEERQKAQNFPGVLQLRPSCVSQNSTCILRFLPSFPSYSTPRILFYFLVYPTLTPSPMIPLCSHFTLFASFVLLFSFFFCTVLLVSHFFLVYPYLHSVIYDSPHLLCYHSTTSSFILYIPYLLPYSLHHIPTLSFPLTLLRSPMISPVLYALFFHI